MDWVLRRIVKVVAKVPIKGNCIITTFVRKIDIIRNTKTVLIEFKVLKFIFSSSCSSYGANENVVDEKSELSPLTAYAKSKVLAEKELLKLKDEDFSPVNLRSATAYGLSPNLRLDLVVNNLTCSAVTTGLVKLLSDGTASRPLVHVEDMARAFIQVLKSSEEKINGQVFNVGSNENNFIR